MVLMFNFIELEIIFFLVDVCLIKYVSNLYFGVMVDWIGMMIVCLLLCIVIEVDDSILFCVNI